MSALGRREARAAARAAGWMFLGFAAASAVAAPRIAGALGYRGRTDLVRALGARDLVVGAGMAFARDAAPWMRLRLAAELADVVLHLDGAASGRMRRGRALAVAGGAALFAAVDYAVLRGLGEREDVKSRRGLRDSRGAPVGFSLFPVALTASARSRR